MSWKNRNICRAISLIFLFIGVSVTNCLGQDFNLSQFYQAPLTVSPSFTGRFQGKARGHIHYRNQWSSFMSKPFRTSIASYDQPWRKFGFGGYLLNTSAGAGSFNEFHFLASASHEVTVDKSGQNQLVYGVQLGFIQKSFNSGAFTFDNQYQKDAGGIFDPTLPSGENFGKTKFTVADINFGVHYRLAKEGKLWRLNAGAAGYHLTNPKEIVLGPETRLPRKLSFYTNMEININEDIELQPFGLHWRQSNDRNSQLGLLGFYHKKGSEADFIFGSSVRLQDALIFHAGIDFEDYQLRLSYDINTSSLKTASGGKGGFEISLTYQRKAHTYIPSID